MNVRSLAMAQLGVALRAAIIVGVGYAAFWLISGAPFSWVWFGVVVLGLTIATNAVVWYAKENREDLLMMAGYMPDMDGEER